MSKCSPAVRPSSTVKYLYLLFPSPGTPPAEPVEAWAGCGDRLLLAAHIDRADADGTRPSALAVVEAHDLNAAILMASRCPASRSATIEIRPLEPSTQET